VDTKRVKSVAVFSQIMMSIKIEKAESRQLARLHPTLTNQKRIKKQENKKREEAASVFRFFIF
jgi:hypothetical protein